MAYFLCTAGGNGKGNSVIVTCDSDFSGKTLTCTNGTKMYYKTCPSTSPYTVTFTGLSAGTWTISAEIEGTTYTTTVVVTDITTSLNYGFSWQRWVDSSSRLHSSDYASLAALLVDEEALRELFLEHSCVDYMASTVTVTPDLTTVLNTDLAAKWLNNSDYALDKCYANAAIKTAMDTADKYGYGEWVITDNTTTPPTWGAKGNVPVMTSNTAPYGEAFGTSGGTSSSGDSYHPFNQSLANNWYPAINVANAYIGYKFVNPIKAKKFTLFISKINGATRTLNFKFQGSNDGTNWNDLKDFAYTPSAIGVIEEVTYEVNNEDYFLNYRLFTSDVMSTTGDTFAINALQFYGRELSVSVPTMTGNTTPYGEAFASSVYGTSNLACKAFDNSTSTCWASVAKANPSELIGEYLGYAFGKSVVVKAVKIVNHSDQGVGMIGNYILQGSNGNQVWDDIKTVSHPTTASLVTVDAINNTNAYSSYRVMVATTNANANQNINIPTLQFYGLDYSEKEFEEGTTKKWLYDHGVELETLTAPNGGVTFGSNQVEISASAANTNYSLDANLDLTDYDLIRFKIGDKYIPTNLEARVNTTEILSWGQSSIAALVASIATNYPNFGLNISAVNGTYYLLWFTNTNSGTPITLKELWLE